jgi:hypothetical protein
MKLKCKICGEKTDIAFVFHPECHDKIVTELRKIHSFSTFFLQNKRTRIGMKVIQSKIERLLELYEGNE